MKRTEIIIVLDSSGSMESIKDKTVSSFNEQVQVIHDASEEDGVKKCGTCGHESGMSTKVSLVTFATQVHEPTLWREDPSSVEELQLKDYSPRGGTALRDAVGTTIAELEQLPHAKDQDTSFLVIIVSDGQENSSRIWEQNRLARKINSLQKTKRWTFTYLGANQDLEQIQKDYAIPVGNIQTWDVSTPMSAGVGYTANAVGTANFIRSRAMGGTCSSNFYNTNDSTAQDITDSSSTTFTESEETKFKKGMRKHGLTPGNEEK